jgi:hypothetical protein
LQGSSGAVPLALANMAASNNSGVRMADAKGTAPEDPCKAKTILYER